MYRVSKLEDEERKLSFGGTAMVLYLEKLLLR